MTSLERRALDQLRSLLCVTACEYLASPKGNGDTHESVARKLYYIDGAEHPSDCTRQQLVDRIRLVEDWRKLR